MENNDKKHKTIITLLSAILVVVVICCISCIAMSSRMNRGNTMSGMHRMPNGEMMMGMDDMDCMKSGDNKCSMMDGKGGMMGGDMSSMMMDMNKALEGKTGDAFDQAFLTEMIIHHEGAVDMAKLVLKTSKRPELIKLANDIIAAQTGEIKMMKDWNKTWFK